ncbi:MAG: sigma-70 family RNA polymerase sigma factor [Clostridia bacterium]
MANSFNDKDDMIVDAVNKYADTVRKISFVFLKNKADVEDVFQEVFLKLLLYEGVFDSEDHKKAWLCKITINKCKDLCKSFWRKNTYSIDDYEIPVTDKIEGELIEEVRALAPKYKEVIYLYYYEGYDVPQIAKLLNQKENTTYSNLRRAREQLKNKLGGTDYEHDV